MQRWRQDARVAGRIASEHPELWIPGALAWIVVSGWVPFVLAVAELPAEGDLIVFGAGVATSGAWPWNAIALGIAILAAALAAFALAALGQVLLLRDLRALAGVRSGRPAAETARVLGAALVGALPVAVAGAALAIALVGVAPDEAQSPDIGGNVALRIALRVAPLLAIGLIALVAGLAFSAAAGRRVTGPRAVPVRRAMPDALRDIGSRPGHVVALVIATLAATVAYAIVAWMLLRVLWAPIGAHLAAGQGMDAGAVLLLLGFVAAWLCLVLGGGALHAWASAWWTLGLADLQPTTSD
jgi:hypothetical protein